MRRLGRALLPHPASVVLLIGVIAAAPAAGWSQVGGDVARTQVIDRPAGALDVVASGNVLAPDEKFGGRYSMLVRIADGVAAVAQTPAGCELVVFDALPGLAARRHAVPALPCQDARPEAFDPETGLLWLCDFGRADDAILLAVDTTDGAVVHALRPIDLAGPMATAWWTCGGALLDRHAGWLVVPFYATNTNNDAIDNVLIAVALDDGQVAATRRLSLVDPEVAVDIRPDAVTKAGTRYAVHARAAFPSAALRGGVAVHHSAVFIVDQALAPVADLYPAFPNGPFDPLSYDGENWMSLMFAARDTLFATAYGSEVVLIDTSVQSAIVRRTDAVQAETLGPTESNDMPPTAWGPDGVYVPFRRTMVALTAPELDVRWVWPGEGAQWRPDQVSPTLAGEVLVQSHRMVTDYETASQDGGRLGLPASDASVLLRLDAADGRVLQRIPLNLLQEWRTVDVARVATLLPDPVSQLERDEVYLDGLPAFFVSTPLIPVDGWLVGADPWGNVAVLGTAGARLSGLHVSDTFPARGTPITLRLDPVGDITKVLVAWGDGASGEVAAAADGAYRSEHIYATPGVWELVVTVLFADGTTRTATQRLDVDGQDLNFMQQQFAPGNQDRTWGVIGLALVLLGAAFGLVARRLGRGRIARGLRELAGIRERSQDDQLAALHDLQAWHAAQQSRLLHGRLTEGQFRVLEDRGGRVSRSVTERILEPIAATLPDAFLQKLDTACRDGYLDAGEVAGLRAAAAGLRLRAGERRVLDGVFEAWSHRDS